MRQPACLTGLFITTLVTLTLEILLTRIFSVITWYHLGFFAISVAMLGMTAGALLVYFRPAAFTESNASKAMGFHALAFGVSIPASHLLTISLRPASAFSWADPLQLLTMFALTLFTAVPFVLSGIIVAVALTKVRLPIGRIYAADLLGAATGCVGAVAVMEWIDPTSAMFLLAGLACVAGTAFLHGVDRTLTMRLVPSALLVLFLACTAVNGILYPNAIAIRHAKGHAVPRNPLVDRWNSHSRIVAHPVRAVAPPYWQPGEGAPMPVRYGSHMNIDGLAGTLLYSFGNTPEEMVWARYDVTNIAYHLRGNDADAAVIGVGGGRDVISALAFGCRRVTGVELNRIFLDILQHDPGTSRFAGLANHPKVELVHDEGRHFMSRSPGRFDLVQMSLIDTWASTSAGALTLGENGLYTVEAWQGFLRALKPRGIFTVSRWFAPDRPSETARLISLATASLLHRGIAVPRDHLALVARGKVSTLIISPDPLAREDVGRLREVSRELGFEVLIAPGTVIQDGLLSGIADSRTLEALRRNTQNPALDLSPPYDASPFFFNMVKPSTWLHKRSLNFVEGGVVQGNVFAGNTLIALMLAVMASTVLAILFPLLRFGGDHGLTRGRLGSGLSYFGLIGVGFMLIEIPLMQRFTILLGHPVYSLAVVLFSLILATGVGSFLSDRVFKGEGRRLFALPVVIAVIGLVLAVSIQPLIDATTLASFPARLIVVCASTTPIGLAMGCCFPVGLGLVARHSERALPWMWGINGAFGVLGGVLAMMISMSTSITGAMLAGCACYLLLPLAIRGLVRPAAS